MACLIFIAGCRRNAKKGDAVAVPVANSQKEKTAEDSKGDVRRVQQTQVLMAMQVLPLEGGNPHPGRSLYDVLFARSKILLTFLQIFSGSCRVGYSTALKDVMRLFAIFNVNHIFSGVDASS